MVKAITSLLRISEGPVFDSVRESCTNCGLCAKECLFLKKYGKPLDILETLESSEMFSALDFAFECSLCGLCVSVCPESIELDRMFLELRKIAVDHGMDLSSYRPILGYEKTGVSGLFTWYALPENCDTVFFPGCTFPGTRPRQTLAIFMKLSIMIPSLGFVLDCCTKPSHDLGRISEFNAMFSEMRDYLINNGVKKILTACPNCYSVFKNYGSSLSIQTIYDYLSSSDKINHCTAADKPVLTIHDSCVVRFDQRFQNSIRTVVEKLGFNVEEMPHSRDKALCCGEGGSVVFNEPELADSWALKRKMEAAGKTVICYCAGCANRLGGHTATHHIVDLYLDPEKTIQGEYRSNHPAMARINRLLLKKKIKKNVPAAVTRKRPHVKGGVIQRGSRIKPLVFLTILSLMIAAVIFGNPGTLVTQEKIDIFVASWGILAPLAFILVYTIAPVLFLPGLPLTVAAGVLFGPFWGVVYSIIGATSGACISFLFTRYFARDLIRSRLNSSRWRNLDKQVAEHGWKIVALTRLIPLFPFNLLNYAFGLTGIGFVAYAVATFIFMLPGCIAFIVFSSSLADLIHGKVSAGFIAGVFLIGLVSMFPKIHRVITNGKKG